MYTYEMVKLADENEKIYICGKGIGNMRYSKSKGFHDGDGYEWEAENFMGTGSPVGGLSYLLHIDTWHELPPKEMTIEEIEKALGYQIKVSNSSVLKWNDPHNYPTNNRNVICKLKQMQVCYSGYYGQCNEKWILYINGNNFAYEKDDLVGWIDEPDSYE
ncbi:hypothetical protein K413DRAFT_4612 [Clostridium sp. ASBs410]|nr:hypothetical protein K413DRAFT_4612 [Clostridium sp. ASBs410]